MYEYLFQPTVYIRMCTKNHVLVKKKQKNPQLSRCPNHRFATTSLNKKIGSMEGKYTEAPVNKMFWAQRSVKKIMLRDSGKGKEP